MGHLVRRGSDREGAPLSLCLLLAISLQLLCAVHGQQGQVLHVDQSASGGSLCGDISNPCSSILEAIERSEEIFNITNYLANEEEREPPLTLKLAHGTYTIPPGQQNRCSPEECRTGLRNIGSYSRLEGDAQHPDMVVIQGDADQINNHPGSWRIEEDDGLFSNYSIEGITFRGIQGFRFSDNANVSISNVVFHNEDSDRRRPNTNPPLSADDVQLFTLDHVTFTGFVLGFGTIIELDDVVEATLSNVDILDSAFCTDSLIRIDDCENVDLTNVLIDGATITGEACVTDANHADGGSAIFAIDVVELTMKDTTVRNVEGVYGAALTLVDTSAGVEGLTVEGCHSLAEGVITLHRSDNDTMTVAMRNSVVTNNTAMLAGAGLLFHSGDLGGIGDFTAENLTITNNSIINLQRGKGGALFVGGDGWAINLEGGAVANCYAEFGGAIYTSADSMTSVNFDGTKFESNSAGDAAGCAYIAGGNVSFTSLVIDGSSSMRAGGAFFMPQTTSSSLMLDDVTVVGSRTVDAGGAICVDGGNIVLKETTISHGTAGSGGCVYVGPGGSLEASDSVFDSCVAEGEGPCVGLVGYGGALFIAKERDELHCATERVAFTNVRFTNNSAQVAGGAYFLEHDRATRSDDWGNCSSEAAWCSSCVMELNSAAFGDDRSAPFAYFTAPVGEVEPVKLNFPFLLDAIPRDGFDVHMSGEHAIIDAVLIDDVEGGEVFLCGPRSARALGGSVSFALLMYLTSRDGSPGSAANAANNGEEKQISVKIEGGVYEGDQNTLSLNIAPCDGGFELDRVLESSLPGSCFRDEDGAPRDVPELFACYPKVHLNDDTRQATLALAGIIYAAGWLPIAAAVYYRKNRVVWSSSVKMLATSAVGYIMVMTSVFLRILPPASSSHCMSQVWLSSVGEELLVGAVLAKNWRVWKIFSLKTLRVVNIPDIALILGVLALTLPTTIVRFVQTVVDPLDVDSVQVNAPCAAATSGIFGWTLAVWSTFWGVGAIAMAYLIRNVPEKFNEWKTVVLLLVIIIFTNIIAYPVASLAPPQIETLITVFTMVIGYTMAMYVILGPKLYMIYKRRDGTLMSTSINSKSNLTFSNFGSDAAESRAGTRGGSSSPLAGGEGEKEVFVFKEKYNRLKAELQRTQKLYERSYENTQELRERYRMVESDLVSLQYEREYRANVANEQVSDISSESDESAAGGGTKLAVLSTMRSRKKSKAKASGVLSAASSSAVDTKAKKRKPSADVGTGTGTDGGSGDAPPSACEEKLTRGGSSAGAQTPATRRTDEDEQKVADV